MDIHRAEARWTAIEFDALLIRSMDVQFWSPTYAT
jgi:hypothetical protein